MLKLIIGVVIATVIVVFAFTVINNATGNPANVSSSLVVTDDSFISIVVTGQVHKPGTYIMKKGDTVGDLILAAGGPTNNSDANAYIEETELIKGVSYYIAPLNDLDDYCGDAKLSKVNINTDNKETLMTINGLGSTIASAVITYRNENGSFMYLEEIMKVNGVGKATFEKIKNNLTLR